MTRRARSGVPLPWQVEMFESRERMRIERPQAYRRWVRKMLDKYRRIFTGTVGTGRKR